MSSVPPNPPPPPVYTPPPSSGGTVSPNRKIMLVLAYLGPLAIIPLLAEKEDREVQWHAKNGLVLFVAYFVAWLALIFVRMIVHVPCVGCLAGSLLAVLYLVLIVLCILKAMNGERFLVPGLSPFADRF